MALECSKPEWEQEKNTLYKYLLVISPTIEVSSDIKKIKCDFSEKYGCSKAAFLIPHITLMNFIQYKKMESRILENFGKCAESLTSFNIELYGFGQFPKHTIYVNVRTKDPIVNIVKVIRDRYRNLLLKPHFVTNPHITIARGMQEEQHKQAWNEWWEKEFISSFDVNQMTLLRKEINESNFRPPEIYEVVAIFPFTGNRPQNGQLKILF